MSAWNRMTLGSGLFLALACSWGCGGSGSSLPSVMATPTHVEVTASLDGTAPTAEVALTLSSAYTEGTLYLSTNYGFEGIGNYALETPTHAGVTFKLYFRDPATLGVGTYVDDLTLYVSTDSLGHQQLPNSPLHVPVTYTVTAATGATVSSLSPANLAAGGTDFDLTVQGGHFTSKSVVSWNGTAVPTTYLSGTKLTARVPATCLSTPGTYPVTVSDPTHGTSHEVMFAVTVPPSGPPTSRPVRWSWAAQASR